MSPISIQRPFKIREEFLVITLLILAFTLRLAHVFLGKSLDQEVWSDMRGYIYIADQVLQNRWEPFHFFQSIGYPLSIAGIKFLTKSNWGFVLGLTQAILSFITLIMTYLLTRKSFGRKVALVTLMIGTIHLPWILALGYALSETFFAFYLSLCAWFSYQLVMTEKRPGLNALGWILSFLCAFWMKGTIVFFGPFFVLGLYLHKRKKALLPIFIISCMMGFGLLAHGFLTYKTIGRFQMTSSAGGLNFVEGKCPAKSNTDPQGYSWLSPLYYQLRLETAKTWAVPFTNSKYFMQQGFECIKTNPFILLLSLESVPLLFYGNLTWPFNQKSYADVVRFYDLYMVIFFVVGLSSVGLALYRKDMKTQEIIIWVFPVIALFLCVYIFKSEARFRFPFDIWIIPLSIVGWFRFLGRS